MSSWKIDPQTGDYMMEKGAPIPTEELTHPAFYRMKIPRGGWMYAPDTNYGSDYHLVKKRVGNGSNQGLSNIGEKALRPIVDDGRALSAEVEVNSDVGAVRGNGVFKVLIEDAQGQPQELNLPQIGV